MTATKNTKKKTTRKKSTAKKPSQAKRGRPEGAKNKELETVRTVPPGCRLCHNTKLTRLEGSRVIVQEYHGTLPSDGRRYTSITTRRMICEKCQSVTAVKSYDYDPDQWKAGPPKI